MYFVHDVHKFLQPHTTGAVNNTTSRLFTGLCLGWTEQAWKNDPNQGTRLTTHVMRKPWIKQQNDLRPNFRGTIALLAVSLRRFFTPHRHEASRATILPAIADNEAMTRSLFDPPDAATRPASDAEAAASADTAAPHLDPDAAEAEAFAGWDGSVGGARRLQSALAARVSLADGFPQPLRLIGGFDVGFEDGGETTHAAAVLLDADTLEVLETRVARTPTRMPYVPGLLSFRELPALLRALALLSRPPQLAFVDGQGIAHPRRLGIAAHFGVIAGLPSVGVAKKILAGSADGELGPDRGDAVPLRDRAGAQTGWLLRSKPRCLPLVVSPGHRVSVDSALALTMRFLGRYRLPEPTRRADAVASRR